jgi:hypothetical protein
LALEETDQLEESLSVTNILPAEFVSIKFPFYKESSEPG